MSHSLSRKNINLHSPSIEEILPDYFKTDYPQLIEVLKAYYETQENEDGSGATDLVKDIFDLRDIYAVDDYLLELILPEMTNGVNIFEVFSDHRLKTLLLANYYRKKGSLEGIKEFFRWLLREEIEVDYTKNNVFRVYNSNAPETAESLIGPKSLHYIKNDKLYQTFALLIKTGAPINTWGAMYERFAHPAGFYYEGQVVIESYLDLSIDEMPRNIAIDNLPVEPYVASFATAALSSTTAIVTVSTL